VHLIVLAVLTSSHMTYVHTPSWPRWHVWVCTDEWVCADWWIADECSRWHVSMHTHTYSHMLAVHTHSSTGMWHSLYQQTLPLDHESGSWVISTWSRVISTDTPSWWGESYQQTHESYQQTLPHDHESGMCLVKTHVPRHVKDVSRQPLHTQLACVSMHTHTYSHMLAAHTHSSTDGSPMSA